MLIMHVNSTTERNHVINNNNNININVNNSNSVAAIIGYYARTSTSVD